MSGSKIPGLAAILFLVALFPVSRADESQFPLLASSNFEDGTASGWQPNNAAHWRVVKQDGSFVYELTAPGEQGKLRAPTSWSIIAGHDVTSFVFTGRMKCPADPSNPHRDLCIIFHFQDPTHFQYVHFSASSDESHNIIGLVNGSDRIKINSEPPGKSVFRLTDTGWHLFKLICDAESGRIEAFIDDMKTPILTAVDKTLGYGLVGIGSFDDTGSFDDLKLWGVGKPKQRTTSRPAGVPGPPSGYEKTVLDVSRALVSTFQANSSAVWPGYDLAAETYLIYLPNKWALLFNPAGAVDEFEAYPEGWPQLGTKVLYHDGSYGDLIGQLAFDFEVGGVKTVAIGLPEDPQGYPSPRDVYLAGFIVHEAFHQFQSGHFGEIPWAREERYPILDRDNTSLAALEMKILMDAVSRAKEGERSEVEDWLRMFAAVRGERWRIGGESFVPYEQGLEIREGTAQYVQMKALSLMTGAPGLDGFAAISLPGLLNADFQTRFKDEAVSPEDMPRNRIYPVGAALGYLCDFLGMSWKPAAQAAGPDFAFHKLISEKIGPGRKRLDEMIAAAKGLYRYDRIVTAAKKLIEDYNQGYLQDLEAFEKQPLDRLDIEFTYRSVSRSRNSLGKTWLVDQGSKSLCNKYRVYTLKNSDLALQVQEAGVYEENDWDAKRKKVVFYLPAVKSIVLDGRPVGQGEALSGPFQALEVKGQSVGLSILKPGTITRKGRTVAIKVAGTIG